MKSFGFLSTAILCCFSVSNQIEGVAAKLLECSDWYSLSIVPIQNFQVCFDESKGARTLLFSIKWKNSFAPIPQLLKEHGSRC